MTLKPRYLTCLPLHVQGQMEYMKTDLGFMVYVNPSIMDERIVLKTKVEMP